MATTRILSFLGRLPLASEAAFAQTYKRAHHHPSPSVQRKHVAHEILNTSTKENKTRKNTNIYTLAHTYMYTHLLFVVFTKPNENPLKKLFLESSLQY